MFFLHVSNKTENLLKHLASVIDADRTTSVFEKEVFLIQSRGMERMLSQGLADHFGCWCNFDYLLPLGFFDLIGSRLGMSITPDFYERDVLTWRLEKLLRYLDHPVYLPLQNYLKADDINLKRYQLARKLANVFDQYQMMRLDMLESWDQGRLIGNHPAEKWQLHLWRRLHEESSEVLHRGILIKRVIDRLRNEKDLSKMLPPRIFIFGLHIMPPLFLEYINSLSLHSQVHLFLLSPCEQYWGDIDTKRRRVVRSIRQLKNGRQMEGETISLHPLLETLGRQGSEFQEMLLENVQFTVELNSFENPLSGQESKLIHHIQSDLLAGEVKTAKEKARKLADDGSLEIISAHSKVREITILKDYIQDWLNNNHDLELRDIIVMAPDIQEYAQLIPAFFEDLPHAIADRSMEKNNTIVAAFVEFLDILKGRFGWSEVFDLFSKPVVHRHFDVSETDLEQLRHWITDSGIRWGLSAAQRQDQGLPSYSENSWSEGLARLLMGYAIEGDEPVEGILPYADIEGSGALPLGGLCHFVDLLNEARVESASERSLSEWSILLLDYLERMFGEQDGYEIVELRTLISEIQSKFSHFHQETIGFEVIRHWLQTSVKDVRSSSGFLRGQLTFCSMLPMRSIPFRCVCLLGIDNGVFPENDRHATFDIMGQQHRQGDRSKRVDDRYMFIEAILAARDCLYISYIGQSDKTNSSIPPSVVVAELLELLKYSYGIDDIVERHPLQSFSRDYFVPETGLFSYHESYCHVVEKMACRTVDREPWWKGELAEEIVQPLQLSSLFSFFSNPQRWFVRERLGIRIDKEKSLIEEKEAFGLTGLEAYLIDQEISDYCLKGLDAIGFLGKLKVSGRWPLGSPGDIAFKKKLSELDKFVETVLRYRPGDSEDVLPVDVWIGADHLVGQLTNLYENGILLYRYAKCKGRDVVLAYLYFLILSKFKKEPFEIRVISRDRHVGFSSTGNTGPSLEEMLEVYREGWTKPVELFVELGWQYFQKQNSPRSSASIDKVRKVFQEQLEGSRYGSSPIEPEWALLYNGADPEKVIDHEFSCLYEQILQRIFSSFIDVQTDTILA